MEDQTTQITGSWLQTAALEGLVGTMFSFVLFGIFRNFLLGFSDNSAAFLLVMAVVYTIGFVIGKLFIAALFTGVSFKSKSNFENQM